MKQLQIRENANENQAFQILVKHERPEYKGVTFINTYYAKGEPQELKQIFGGAFKTAHPTWPINKITVEPYYRES